MLDTLSLITVALLSLSFLVVVHELGHFVAAKIVGIWPEEFGIGLPPRIRGKKFGDTIWSLNALPLGGFVRLHGESGDGTLKYPEKAFVNKPKWARGFVALAGVFMNFLFAFLAFSLIYFILGIPNGVRIDKVASESPADALGLQKGDLITKVQGRPVYMPLFFTKSIADRAGREIEVEYKSESGDVFVKTTKVREKAPQNEGLLGISYDFEYKSAASVKGALSSLYFGALQTYDFSVYILVEFGNMFKTLFAGKVPQGLAGPLGVVAITAEAAKSGFLDLLNISALISLNLALINLVPFPPLDGSRVVSLVIELFVGRKKLPKIEEKVFAFGMYFLLGLMLLLTFREVPKLITAGSLSGFVESLITPK